MKTTREQTEQTLLSYFQSQARNRSFQDFIIQKFNRHKVSAAVAKSITTNTLPLTNLSETMLCLFMKYVYEYDKNPEVNVKNYFSDEEIRVASLYKEQDKTVNSTIKFENVYQLNENQYVIPYVDMKFLIQYWDRKMIIYNIATQRGADLKRSGDKIIEKASIKARAVEEISEFMKAGKFTANMISLNIRRSGEERFEYDKKYKTLTIDLDDENTFLDIIDGAHRLSGASRALNEIPNLEIGTVVNVLNYTEEEAQAFIVQEDKRTPIPKQILKSYDVNNNYTVITRDVNKWRDSNSNVLFNKLAQTSEEIRIYNKYVTIDAFSKSLEQHYKINSPSEATKLKTYIIDFFNALIYMIEGKNLELLKPNMFIGYIALSATLYNNENWEKVLESKIEDIVSSDWTVINSIREINKSAVRRISELFIGEVK